MQVAGAAIVAAAAIPSLGGTKKKKNGEKRVRVRPYNANQKLTPSEIVFCDRARFTTAADAMRAAAARGIPVVIYKK